MKLKILYLTSIIIVVASVLGTYFFLTYEKTITSITTTPIVLREEYYGPPIYFPRDLFDVFIFESDLWGYGPDGTPIYNTVQFALKPENNEIYNEIGVENDPQNTVVIAPIFTLSAYEEGGFYDFYSGNCGTECISSIPIQYDKPPKFTSSGNSLKVLALLGYPFLTDIEIDKNPEILKKFDKVIVLHNEYVTRAEFEAITTHPKVMYLHPNALYAEIIADYTDDTISLVRGHGYPSPEIRNGFNWKFDNSKLEYDVDCSNWEFYEIENGIMLNCYPEVLIYTNATFLKMIKEY